MKRLAAALGRLALVTGLAAALSVPLVVAPTTVADAASLSGSQFQAGYIVSDSVFYNSSAMSASAIQSFLSSQNSGCASGHTCLANYTTPTNNEAAEAGLCTGYTGLPSETAAAIIAKVATSCGVNPQVLIVLLQKEQSLVTSTAPSATAYKTATGYGCPDSTGCSAKYYGFFNQVYLAARQFKLYRLYPYNYNYVAGQSNYILYSPKTSCGGTAVYIQNQATAGLYDYTPYQPNAAALANLHGTGDKCSSYGNRNFWVFFSTWFGNPLSGGTAPDSTPDPTAFNAGGLMVRTPSGVLRYWTDTGNVVAPYLNYVQLPGTAWKNYNLMTSGDVDGDCAADLVATQPNGTLWLFRNSGNAANPYPTPVQIAASGWNSYTTILAADVDGDSYADLLALDSSGQLYLYRNSHNTAAPFASAVSLGTGFGAYDQLVAGDVDGDGYADLIGRQPNGSLWLFTNTHNANQPFGAPVQIAASGWSSYNTIVAVDIDGDGKVDLVTRTPDGKLWLYVNTGNLAQPYGTTPAMIGAGWNSYDLFVGAQVTHATLAPGSCPPQTPSAFPDVPNSSTFCLDIAWLRAQQVTTGYSDGGFHPAASISRQAMAAFLFRLAAPGQASPSCGTTPFRDVSQANPFCGTIAWLKTQHVTTGYSDGGFHPAASISRQAMAAFLYRIGNGGRHAPPCTSAPFPDVPAASGFCGAITWLKSQQITTGYSDGGFHPTASISRQAMAAFLHRLHT